MTPRKPEKGRHQETQVRRDPPPQSLTLCLCPGELWRSQPLTLCWFAAWETKG